MPKPLIAGAAATDVTPGSPQFLFGYPHVRRYSTGIHDRLFSSALFLFDGQTPLLLVASDVIFIGRDIARRVRDRIERETGIPAANMMITATHTHSGPITVEMLSNEADEAVPKVDSQYLAQLEDGIVDAAVRAHRNAGPASIARAVADGSCVGTNRHDTAGPAISEVPVMLVRDAGTGAYRAAMVVCSMHPTVLHGDSTLLSGDFPAMTRQYLQEHVLGRDCPVIYHTGPCGNQSPRHVTRANKFAEAKRLGGLLGQSIAKAIESVEYTDNIRLSCTSKAVELPPRVQRPVAQAERELEQSIERLASLRQHGADRRDVRTAECDWFGAEESLALAKAAASGRVNDAIAALMPAEVVLMQIGRWSFAGWPGEVFVEFALEVRKHFPDCYVISLANGELQGYLVTAEAVRQRWYEAMNSLFASPQAGMALVGATLELLRDHPPVAVV